MAGTTKQLYIEDYTQEEIEAIKRVNRSEPLRDKFLPLIRNQPQNTSIAHIKPLYHHPLPLSRHRYQHEKILRDVLTHQITRQALTAVTLQNAWVLEEVLKRGAPMEVADKNGYTPLHIACSQNDFECVMVLINFGANINAPTAAGITPLFLAEAANATQVVNLLQSKQAILKHGNHRHLPGATILEVGSLKKHNSVLNAKGDCVGMPHEHTWF